MAGPQKAVAFAALRHGAFRAYFGLGLVSMIADNIEHVIAYWVIFQAFHSPMLAGFAVVSHWIPFLLFGVHVGALADRYDCRKLIQASQLLLIGTSLAWGLLFLNSSLQVWHAMVLLVLHGLAGALSASAVQLMIHDIVGREHLQSAVRLSSTGRFLSHLLGPAVGGGLMLLLGPGWGLLVNALIYLPFTLWLLTTPFTGHRRETVEAARSPRIGLGEAVRVLREVSGNRTILVMVALGGLSSLLVGNAFQPLMPQFARDLGADDTGLLYSALLAANGVGAAAGGLLLESMGLLQPRARTAILLAGLWCVAMVGFAAAPNYLVALAVLFLAGVFNLAFSSMALTLVQLEAPGHQRGRVIGLFNVSQLGLRVGSGITVGVWGAFIGIQWSLGLSAAVLLGFAIVLFAFAGPRQLERRSTPA